MAREDEAGSDDPLLPVSPAHSGGHRGPGVSPHSGPRRPSDDDRRDILSNSTVSDEDRKAHETQVALRNRNGHVTEYGEKHDGAAIDGEEERETWGNKGEFLLSIIGFAVDLANLWRFPYLCYKNGGGAFLIPYFLMLIFGALPLFFMELILGQFHRQGSISLWRIAPIFKGIGWASVLMAWMVAFYYNVIIGWAFYYIFMSMQKELPWVGCDNSWNTPRCVPIRGNEYPSHNASLLVNLTSTVATTVLSTVGANASLITKASDSSISSAQEYFERAVLQVQESDGLADLGEVRWPLALTTLLSFTILYFSLWKGVASSGKVVWVTATAPYVVMTALLIRGVLLPGAGDGILFFLTPRLEPLKNWTVWIDAANQIFYSVGAGFGVHLAYASYNKFDNNCYRDCLITAGVNSFTSIFSGIVVFSYIGYMANRMSKPIDEVATEGVGLVFVVYPEAVATLPGSQVWSIIFFLLMLTLGLDSAMGGLEAVITGLRDEYKPFFLRYKYSREVLVLCVCIGGFLFALINTTQGGYFTLRIMDSFAAGTSLLFIVFLEAVAVSWFYGLDQFCEDAKQMLGFVPGLYWRLCWKFFSPLFVLCIVIASVIGFQPLAESEKFTTGPYQYPHWSMVLGWLISFASMSLVPIFVVYRLVKYKGSFRTRLALAISPECEHEHIKRTGFVTRFHAEHWLSLGNGLSLNCRKGDGEISNGFEMHPPQKV